MPDFKSRLKRLRKQKSLTQQEVGDRIGVSKVAVSGYENGIRSPETDTLKKIADLFGTSIDYLIGYSDIPNQATDENNATIAHYVSDMGLLQGTNKLIVDNEIVEEELLKEALDYIRAKRIMKNFR
ncbi:helix-turn-helix domain-containing protein [Anaerobacillus sp. MEB173]|uniref:helix-turn-helix domain-containing protein n=1 Tax=Anaerobacillus sp. MEB173 TaxID=3383345 RepID=UPI003F92C59F